MNGIVYNDREIQHLRIYNSEFLFIYFDIYYINFIFIFKNGLVKFENALIE